MASEFEITISAMAFGGDAVGRLPDGRTTFVPFALPGERIRIELTGEKTSFARAKLLEVIEPSPLRIQPRCRHFGQCGGCRYQHLSYPSQLEVKRHIVAEQLRRMAGLNEYPVAPAIPSPKPWSYRNSIQFHVSSAGKLGFQRAASNDLIEVEECLLPVPAISALWPSLELEPEVGIKRLLLREGVDGDLLMGLEGETDLPPDFSVDFPMSAVFLGPERQYVLSGEDALLMQVLDRDFRVSIGSFFQANLNQAEAMVRHVLALAGDLNGKTVIDGYCGVGLFSAFLAEKAGRLIAVESSEPSCNDFAVNLDALDNVELYMDQMENVLPALDVKAELVMVDPPRAGLAAQVTASLISLQPQQIIYVSCDPATLARDIRSLVRGGYELSSVTPFDQFPQTAHIEAIADLRLKEE